MQDNLPSSGTLAQKLEVLKKGYLQNMKLQVEELHRITDDLKKKKIAAHDLKQLSEISHSLSGSGGTFGFSEITKAGRSLNDVLREITHPLSAEDNALLAEKTAALETACRAAIKSA